MTPLHMEIFVYGTKCYGTKCYDDFMKIDPLHFWSKIKAAKDCPHMCNMARSILAIPAQSSGCERVFSRMKLVVSPYRSRLTNDFAENIILSSYRYHNQSKPIVPANQFPLFGKPFSIESTVFEDLIADDDEVIDEGEVKDPN